MTELCHISGCKHDVPAALAEHKLCVLHFTLSLEAGCAEMRRETALGNTPHERQREIMRFITENGERLARVATSGLHLTDDSESQSAEYISDLDEPARKSGPCGDAHASRPQRHSPVEFFTPQYILRTTSAPRRDLWCLSEWRGRR